MEKLKWDKKTVKLRQSLTVIAYFRCNYTLL